jgi:quercetin dioxygenase-like cupin family protein
MAMEGITVFRTGEAAALEFDWGALTWYASAALGNSDHLTVGLCEIRPGCANPRHHHPNCEEVLRVIRGRIVHTGPGGSEVVLEAGDTITIPSGCVHNARNVGDEPALLSICFSSPNRETLAE